jgi:hypothetical protein
MKKTFHLKTLYNNKMYNLFKYDISHITIIFLNQLIMYILLKYDRRLILLNLFSELN